MGALIFFALAGVLLFFVFRAFRRQKSSEGQLTDSVIAHEWPPLEEFEFEIVGESNYQKALKRIAGAHGDEAANVHVIALIVPENSNKHDDMAVRVDVSGDTVGYLSRDDARSFRRRLAAKKIGIQPTRCAALICGGFKARSGQRASYGVKLDIKPFEN